MLVFLLFRELDSSVSLMVGTASLDISAEEDAAEMTLTTVLVFLLLREVDSSASLMAGRASRLIFDERASASIFSTRDWWAVDSVDDRD